jgi:hypothetical protein
MEAALLLSELNMIQSTAAIEIRCEILTRWNGSCMNYSVYMTRRERGISETQIR